MYWIELYKTYKCVAIMEIVKACKIKQMTSCINDVNMCVCIISEEFKAKARLVINEEYFSRPCGRLDIVKSSYLNINVGI
jgi:hypothetical protein